MAPPGPAGPRHADFASHRARLIIELDGGQHTQATDAARTAMIKREGYRVIRFWNTEVLANPEGVHTRLTEALAQIPPPSNSG